MENKTIEFLLSEEKTILFENSINEVFDNESPFKEIVEKDDYTGYSVVFDGDKENPIKFSDLFHLKVNVKNVGGFDFLFKQEGFEKEKVIDGVSGLKEMPVENVEQAKEKVNALFNTIKESNPLFFLYSPKGEFKLEIDSLDFSVFGFYVKRFEKPKPPKKERKKIEKLPRPERPAKPVKAKETAGKEEKPVKVKEKRERVNYLPIIWNRICIFWDNVCAFFEPLRDNAVHYAFILISVFLIGFSSSVGAYYCYAGNNVFYFLFVCSLVGAVLNYFVLYDYFKDHILLSNDFVLTVMDVLVSIGASIGGFFIFFVLQKEVPESLSGPGIILLIMAAVVLGVNLITVPFAYFMRKRKEK